ncbi:olfactory receptor 8J1-like [Loxodonta africana]|uniref:olfactory receptor 8J1-like n=1 Tax=Loxodonta africana TaxID=9785 RepID=UPI0030CCF9C6
MDLPELQVPLFFVFLVIYGLTVVGNLGTIILISVDSRLPTPMDFFLLHLAITNLGNSTTIAPKMLLNFLVKKKTISYTCCAAQLGGFLVFMVGEIFILAAVAYDRYVAICNPLLYMVVVSQQICLPLESLTYLYSLTLALTASSSSSCCDTYIPETVVFTLLGTNLFFSMIIVLISCFNIVLAILRILSKKGDKKLFLPMLFT